MLLTRSGRTRSAMSAAERSVPDRLRQEALHEIFARFDVQGAHLLAAHAQPNENAWLLGRRRSDRSSMWEWSGREDLRSR